MVDIVMLVDQSISIGNAIGSYVACINNVIGTQRTLNPGALFSLYTFNHNIYTKCSDVRITDLQPLGVKDIIPSGSTSLYDAVHVVLTKRKHVVRPTIMIVMTDGHDNFSKVRPNTILPLIQELMTRKWFFVFLGTDYIANILGGKMGFQTCVMYDNSPQSLKKASNAINIAISKACKAITGFSNHLSDQDIPDDVRELMKFMGEMKI